MEPHEKTELKFIGMTLAAIGVVLAGLITLPRAVCGEISPEWQAAIIDAPSGGLPPRVAILICLACVGVILLTSWFNKKDDEL